MKIIQDLKGILLYQKEHKGKLEYIVGFPFGNKFWGMIIPENLASHLMDIADDYKSRKTLPR